MGYYDVFKAKRSLLASLQEGEDFIIATDGSKTALFEQNQGDTEIIYLSRDPAEPGADCPGDAISHSRSYPDPDPAALCFEMLCLHCAWPVPD